MIAAFFWALFDLTRKLSLRYIHPKALLILFSLIQVIFFFFWCLKESFFFLIIPYSIPGISLVILSIFSALIFLKSIKDSELSLTIPLLSFTPLFSSIFSFIFLNEELDDTQYFGILLIIFGTLILYSKKFNIFFFFRSFQIIKSNQSARLMILVAFCWSLTPILDKICLKYSSINLHGLIQSLCISIILSVFSMKELIHFKKQKKKYSLIFITILVGTIATVLQFFAILTNFVPIMESIKRATGQFSAVLFGRVFFNENINFQKVIGVSLLSIGVAFII